MGVSTSPGVLDLKRSTVQAIADQRKVPLVDVAGRFGLTEADVKPGAG